MPLRVMTYNILDNGKNRETYILDVIKTVGPDIVILQEVFTEEFLQDLSEKIGMTYYIGAGNKKRKVALLSKIAVRSFKSYHPSVPIWRNFIDAEIEYQPNKTARIIGVHPIANLGILFEIWRWFEAKYIIKHLQSYKNQPCLIAGDFNAIAPEDKVRTEIMPSWLKLILYLQGNRVYYFSIKLVLSKGFADCYRCFHSDPGFTLPPPAPNSRLDYIFVNAKMKTHLTGCWVVREPESVNKASDHYPVLAEFDFANRYV